jgi:hypothetical protein
MHLSVRVGRDDHHRQPWPDADPDRLTRPRARPSRRVNLTAGAYLDQLLWAHVSVSDRPRSVDTRTHLGYRATPRQRVPKGRR